MEILIILSVLTFVIVSTSYLLKQLAIQQPQKVVKPVSYILAIGLLISLWNLKFETPSNTEQANQASVISILDEKPFHYYPKEEKKTSTAHSTSQELQNIVESNQQQAVNNPFENHSQVVSNLDDDDDLDRDDDSDLDFDDNDLFDLNLTSSASFPGGKVNLQTYLTRTIMLNHQVRHSLLKGTITVQFSVDEYGKVSSPVIVNSFDDNLNDVVLRSIKQMPVWKPAIEKGIPKGSIVHLPIRIK